MLQNSNGSIPIIIYSSWGDTFTKITMQMVSPIVGQLGGPDRTFYYTSRHWLLPCGTLWVVNCMPCLYASTGTHSLTLIHTYTDAKHSSMLLRGPLNKIA